MKKLVVKLDLQDGKAKQKALKLVSTLQGIDSIAVEMKEKKLTVVGTVDPINVVSKLRRYWHTDIVLVGPAKEPEKKEEGKAAAAEEPKKDQQAASADAETKKEEGEQKKEEGEKEEGKKKEGEEKEIAGEDKKKVEAIAGYYNNNNNYYYDPRVVELVKAYNYNRAYPHMATSYYHVQSMEENPNACVIS